VGPLFVIAFSASPHYEAKGERRRRGGGVFFGYRKTLSVMAGGREEKKRKPSSSRFDFAKEGERRKEEGGRKMVPPYRIIVQTMKTGGKGGKKTHVLIVNISAKIYDVPEEGEKRERKKEERSGRDPRGTKHLLVLSPHQVERSSQGKGSNVLGRRPQCPRDSLQSRLPDLHQSGRGKERGEGKEKRSLQIRNILPPEKEDGKTSLCR